MNFAITVPVNAFSTFNAEQVIPSLYSGFYSLVLRMQPMKLYSQIRLPDIQFQSDVLASSHDIIIIVMWICRALLRRIKRL
jgi:hypothetical protein